MRTYQSERLPGITFLTTSSGVTQMNIVLLIMGPVAVGASALALVMFYHAWMSYRNNESWSSDLTTAVLLTACASVSGGTIYFLNFLESMKTVL